MNVNTLLTDREQQQADTLTVNTTLMTTIPILKESVTEEVCLEGFNYETEMMEEYTDTETHDEWYFLFNQKKISFDDLDVLIELLNEEYSKHSQTNDTEPYKEEELAIAPINDNIYAILIVCQEEANKPYLVQNNIKIYLSDLSDEIKNKK
jgi:hypothetical protein